MLTIIYVAFEGRNKTISVGESPSIEHMYSQGHRERQIHVETGAREMDRQTDRHRHERTAETGEQ